MIGLTSYLNYAIAQKRDLSVAEGIIIYSTVASDIPQEVFFIPVAINKDRNFDAFIKETLSNPSNYTYVVYFQGIRWIMPDLSSVVRSLKSVPIQYGTKNKLMQLSFGKITFDKTYPGDPDIEIDLTVTKVDVIYNETPFKLNVTEWPAANGVAKLFEKIDF